MRLHYYFAFYPMGAFNEADKDLFFLRQILHFLFAKKNKGNPFEGTAFKIKNLSVICPSSYLAEAFFHLRQAALPWEALHRDRTSFSYYHKIPNVRLL